VARGFGPLLKQSESATGLIYLMDLGESGKIFIEIGKSSRPKKLYLRLALSSGRRKFAV
jgi:hypothetical protein